MSDENLRSSVAIRGALATILDFMEKGGRIYAEIGNANFGDDFFIRQRTDVLGTLLYLERAEPEAYLEALRYFGPEAVFSIAQKIAGGREAEALTTFRAAVLRLGRPDMDAENAAILCDPKSEFKGTIRLVHSNPRNDLGEALLEPVMAYLGDAGRNPEDVPDSKDFFVLGLAFGSLGYGGRPDDACLCNAQALRLIDEALRLAEANPSPEDAVKIRVGTLLGIAGHALYMNGYDIFNREKSDSLTLTQMLENAMNWPRSMLDAIVNEVREMRPELSREEIIAERMRDKTDFFVRMLEGGAQIEPYPGKIRVFAEGDGPYRDLFTYPVRTVYALSEDAMSRKIARSLAALREQSEPQQALPPPQPECF